MAFCKLTSACNVPNLYMVFVFRFANTAANALNYPNKTLTRLKQNKIEYPRNINPNSRNSVCRNNDFPFRDLNFVIMVLTFTCFGRSRDEHTVRQAFL